MAEPTIASSRNPYASAGMIVVAAIIAILLVTFAVSRFTRPPEEPVTAAAPAPRAPAAGAPAALAPPAPGQTAAADASLTGSAHPDDLVTARQLLMDGNETATMPIDRAAGGADIPIASLKEQAYAIYTWLTVAPHLFASSTKPVVSADSSPPATAATAAVWEDFDAFYDASTAAAGVAYDASQAADLAAFRPLAMQLRAACDSCHEKYMHVFDPATGK